MQTARGWWKVAYLKHTVEVPGNKKYLAANSAKRNPSAPRGALFPACPSKWNRTTAPNDESDSGDDDGRIPTLPPGPSTTTDPIGFHIEDPQQNPNQTMHLTPGLLQLVFSNWFCPQTQPTVTVPNPQWGLTNPQSFPPPSWERPLPCVCTYTPPYHLMHS